MHLRPAALLALALATLPAIALADRVVVGSIRGDERDQIRTRLETVLRERVDVVPWSEFRAAYRGMDAQAIKTACRSVDARAIVIGDVQGPRRLNLIALSCDTGEIASESEVQLRRGVPRIDALNAAIAGMFFEQGARSLLAWAARSGRGETANGPDARPNPASQPARQPAPAPASQPGPAAPPVEATPAEAAETEPEADAVASLLDPGHEEAPARRAAPAAVEDEPASASIEREVSPAAADQTFLELALGATVSTRSLDVVDRTGQTVAYSGGGYTELGGQLTLFPIAIVTRARWARAIGLTGSFTKGVGVPAAEGSGLNVDTVDGGAALVGRFLLGRTFELRPQAGLGFRGFAIDWNPDVASFNYQYVRLGIDARATLYRRPELREGTIGALSVGIAGGYDLVTDVGEAAEAYGRDASGGGFDAGAYATILLGKSLFVTAGGELTRLTATFAGEGTLDRLADSSADVFARGYLRAGIALR